MHVCVYVWPHAELSSPGESLPWGLHVQVIASMPEGVTLTLSITCSEMSLLAE